MSDQFVFCRVSAIAEIASCLASNVSKPIVSESENVLNCQLGGMTKLESLLDF